MKNVDEKRNLRRQVPDKLKIRKFDLSGTPVDRNSSFNLHFNTILDCLRCVTAQIHASATLVLALLALHTKSRRTKMFFVFGNATIWHGFQTVAL